MAMTLQPRELGANAWADRGGITEPSVCRVGSGPRNPKSAPLALTKPLIAPRSPSPGVNPSFWSSEPAVRGSWTRRAPGAERSWQMPRLNFPPHSKPALVFFYPPRSPRGGEGGAEAVVSPKWWHVRRKLNASSGAAPGDQLPVAFGRGDAALRGPAGRSPGMVRVVLRSPRRSRKHPGVLVQLGAAGPYFS